MRKVFISYAGQDGSTVARWLHDRFNHLDGWSAWMDRQLHADSVFSAELQLRINEAILVAWGVPRDGRKVLLHLTLGNKESEAARLLSAIWSNVACLSPRWSPPMGLP